MNLGKDYILPSISILVTGYFSYLIWKTNMRLTDIEVNRNYKDVKRTANYLKSEIISMIFKVQPLYGWYKHGIDEYFKPIVYYDADRYIMGTSNLSKILCPETIKLMRDFNELFMISKTIYDMQSEDNNSKKEEKLREDFFTLFEMIFTEEFYSSKINFEELEVMLGKTKPDGNDSEILTVDKHLSTATFESMYRYTYDVLNVIIKSKNEDELMISIKEIEVKIPKFSIWHRYEKELSTEIKS